MNPLERYVRRIVRQEIAAHNASQLPTGIPPALVGVPALGRAPGRESEHSVSQTTNERLPG
jgi:hypothetical protein